MNKTGKFTFLVARIWSDGNCNKLDSRGIDASVNGARQIRGLAKCSSEKTSARIHQHNSTFMAIGCVSATLELHESHACAALDDIAFFVFVICGVHLVVPMFPKCRDTKGEPCLTH